MKKSYGPLKRRTLRHQINHMVTSVVLGFAALTASQTSLANDYQPKDGDDCTNYGKGYYSVKVNADSKTLGLSNMNNTGNATGDQYQISAGTYAPNGINGDDVFAFTGDVYLVYSNVSMGNRRVISDQSFGRPDHAMTFNSARYAFEALKYFIRDPKKCHDYRPGDPVPRFPGPR